MHVKDTIILNLKENIFFILSHYNLHIQIIRGQGFNGASKYVKSGIDCKLYSLNIALIHIMYIA